MIDEKEYFDIIKKTFPELNIVDFKFLGKGMYGVVCLVNHDIVVKVPLKVDKKLNDVNKEIYLLQKLENKLSFEIPHILYTKKTERGWIIAETLVNGVTYSQELHDSFDDKTKSDIIRQIGKMARILHDVKITDEKGVLTICKYENTISVFHEYFSKDVQKCFSDADKNRINSLCSRYEYLSIHHPVEPVLVHADLHFGNMMFDIKNKKIIGLIDWGAASFAEPSRDMHYYYGDGAKDFLAGYGDNGDKYLAERQRFQAVINFLSNISEDIKADKSPDKNINKLLGIL